MDKYIYSFTEGNKDLRNLLGGKGANLCEMTNIGLPVPPGFIISTEYCISYQNSKTHLKGFLEMVKEYVSEVEKKIGKNFGDKHSPLLFSVRSGARVSMPGMMDTVLNLGLNDETIQGLIKETGDKRFAYDAYRRFINMYGDVVMGVDHEHFEKILSQYKKNKAYHDDTELKASDW